MTKNKESITVDGQNFELVLTRETEGYVFVHREYSLFYKKKLIAEQISSVKSAYLIALNYLNGATK